MTKKHGSSSWGKLQRFKSGLQWSQVEWQNPEAFSWKKELRKMYWTGHCNLDWCFWSFPAWSTSPPTLAHLFSNRAHSKVPPIVHCDGHISQNCYLSFLGSPWATETDAEINFVTRESISFHFPGKKFHENQSSHRKFWFLAKSLFLIGNCLNSKISEQPWLQEESHFIPAYVEWDFVWRQLDGPWGGGKVTSIIIARAFNYQELRLLWSYPITQAWWLGAVSDGPAETMFAMEVVLSSEEIGSQELTSLEDLFFPDRWK